MPAYDRFLTSGDPGFFRRIAERWLGCSVQVTRAVAEAIGTHFPLILPGDSFSIFRC